MDGINKAAQSIIAGQTQTDPAQDKQLTEKPPDRPRGIADNPDTLQNSDEGTLISLIAAPDSGSDPDVPIVEQIAEPNTNSDLPLVMQIAQPEPDPTVPLLDLIAAKGNPPDAPLLNLIAQKDKYTQLLQMLGEQGKLDTQQIQNLTTNFQESQSVREKFQQALNSLQDQDKLSQFEIKTLMSQFNDNNATSDIFKSSLNGNTKLDGSDNQTLTNLFDRKSELKSSFDSRMQELQSNGNLMEIQIRHLVDERTRFLEELSNILEKMNKTSADISQNIK